MNTALKSRWAEALDAYLRRPDEAVRERAYELGREAIEQGLGVVELSGFQEEAFESLLRGRGSAREPLAAARAAADFFAELVAPYEMMLRGSREANEALRRLNQDLEKRIEERSRHLLEAQEALHRSEKLEALGRLAGGVAHDFNNLLTLINGYVSLGLNELPEGHGAAAAFREVGKAGQRAAALTRQLLAFSRSQPSSPQPLDLNRVVGDMEKMFRRLLPEDIRLDLRLAPDLGRVMADLSQVEQILMNLVLNARDAIEGPGEIHVETANTELDQGYASLHFPVTPGDYVMLAVTDTGRGMDEATLSRVFEPFFSTKPPGQGTGLGLATVYAALKNNGGTIWAYSEPGRGSTFKAYLPRMREASAGPEAPPPPVRGGSEAVLVVEDDDAVRALTVQMLRRQGYQVSEAANGLRALEQLDAAPGGFALVVSDVVMPEMGGVELARAVRSRLPGMKILLVSGYTTSAVIKDDGEEGLAFLQKPFTPDGLNRKVRELLDGP